MLPNTAIKSRLRSKISEKTEADAREQEQIKMGEFSANQFPHVIWCRPNQKNTFSRCKRYDFSNLSNLNRSSCIDGWRSDMYFHPPFRTGGFLEIAGLQIHQCSTPMSFQATAGRLFHADKPVRFHPTGKMVAEQRIASKAENNDPDNPVNEFTNVGYETIRMVRADIKARKRGDLNYEKQFKGWLMPGKRETLTYETAERKHSDQLFMFWGFEGSTIRDDIYNHSTFYKTVNGVLTAFVDVYIQADYVDLTRYTGHSLEQQVDINVFDQKAVFNFWQNARAYRAQHPLPEVGSIQQFNQLVHFNPKTLDNDSLSDAESELTVIPNHSSA